MSTPVFLVDPGRLAATDVVVLDGDEGRHAAVVRRITVGEVVELTDGVGRTARCVVVDAGRQHLTCQVRTRSVTPPSQPHLVVVQALPKGDRGEVAVETMTEVGVDEILPWSAARCMVRWKGERGEKSLRRWRATAREATKQARRSWLPTVHDAANTAGVVTRLRRAALGVVLHEEASQPLGSLEPPPAGDVVLVVGPEGGIAPAERAAFEAAGAVTARLGPSVLRTSTAGTVAAGVVLSRTRRWA